MGDTEHNGSHLAKRVKLGKMAHTIIRIDLGQMSHIWPNGLHLAKWVPFKNNGSQLKKLNLFSQNK